MSEKESVKGFDTGVGAKSRQIDKKGTPLLRVGGVPGYNLGEGTPGWIKSAATAAAKRTNINTSEHRSRAHQGGAPPYGHAKSPEHIHGGQATRVGKDTD